METKYATFAGGGSSASLVQWTDSAAAEVTASLAKASLESGSGSRNDQLFSTSSNAPSAAPPTQKKAGGMVKFRGGGPPPMRVATSCSVSVGGSSDADGNSESSRVDKAESDKTDKEGVAPQEPYVKSADDGGMMFSTS